MAKKKAAAKGTTKAKSRDVAPPVAPGEPPARTAKQIKVRATAVGYYDDKLRRVDDVFTINDRRRSDGRLAELGKWMVLEDADVPEKITSNNEAIRREHDEILGARQSGASAARDKSPLGDD